MDVPTRQHPRNPLDPTSISAGVHTLLSDALSGSRVAFVVVFLLVESLFLLLLFVDET